MLVEQYYHHVLDEPAGAKKSERIAACLRNTSKISPRLLPALTPPVLLYHIRPHTFMCTSRGFQAELRMLGLNMIVLSYSYNF